MAEENQNRRINVSSTKANQGGLEERLQGILQAMSAPKTIPSALLAVETMDRSFRWVGTAGTAYADGAPMLPVTPFYIASVTKLYIASTILMLHERNLVGLDQPMAAYLPKELVGGLLRLDGVDYTGQITVQHLLRHSSGLPDYLEDKPKNGRNFAERLFDEDFAFELEDIIEVVHDLPPHFPPQPLDSTRQKIRYCDTNYQILIAIIEAVTGGPLHAAFAELLYRPLGLENTWHPGTRPDAPEPADLWLDEGPLQIPLAMESFGDVISTADDLLRFMHALVRGEVFEDPATHDLMRGHWNTFGFSLNPVRLSPGWPIEYGLGMMRFKIPRLLSPFRSVPAVTGHTGATGSWLFYCEALDVLLAGTVNQLSAAAVPFRYIPKILQSLQAAGI